MDDCHICLLFPTDSVIFIHSFPFMSRQESHLHFLWSPTLLLVFCYPFSITHSDYFTPLFEAHQKNPNALGIKIKIKAPHHSPQYSAGSGSGLPL
jgi:hypothetical protein